MKLLYCDESNLEERGGDFLIYGGLAVDAGVALDLSAAIDQLRGKFGVPSDFKLKFNPGPKHLSHDEFVRLKQELMELAAKFDVKLIAYVILHDIATSPDEARRNGINTVCFHFDSLLERTKDPGLVLIDRFTDQGNQIDAHLSEKFSMGVKGLPYSKELRLKNIVGFHYSAIGQSHFPSLVDVVLGSLRFSINVQTRKTEKHQGTAAKLLGMLGPMIPRERGDHRASELGFTFSPKVVKHDGYREQYESLKTFLAANGVETAQPIGKERVY